MTVPRRQDVPHLKVAPEPPGPRPAPPPGPSAVSAAIEQVGLWRDRYHRYTVYFPKIMAAPDGPFVGITTAGKIQDTLIPGDLAAWGAGIALDYIHREYGDRLLDLPNEIEMRKAALEKVAEARNIGTAVHARIEHILVGEPQSQVPCPRHPPEFGRVGACALLPELVPPYIYAFTQFLAEHRPEFLMVEFMVVSLRHRYAGTGDIACRMGPDAANPDRDRVYRKNRVALIDVKTGRQRASHRLQLAGLAAAEFVGEPGNPEPIPLPKFQDYYTLLLSPTGYELVQHDVTAKDRRHFLSLVRTYRSLRDWEAQ